MAVRSVRELVAGTGQVPLVSLPYLCHSSDHGESEKGEEEKGSIIGHEWTCSGLLSPAIRSGVSSHCQDLPGGIISVRGHCEEPQNES